MHYKEPMQPNTTQFQTFLQPSSGSVLDSFQQIGEADAHAASYPAPFQPAESHGTSYQNGAPIHVSSYQNSAPFATLASQVQYASEPFLDPSRFGEPVKSSFDQIQERQFNDAVSHQATYSTPVNTQGYHTDTSILQASYTAQVISQTYPEDAHYSAQNTAPNNHLQETIQTLQDRLNLMEISHQKTVQSKDTELQAAKMEHDLLREEWKSREQDLCHQLIDLKHTETRDMAQQRTELQDGEAKLEEEVRELKTKTDAFDYERADFMNEKSKFVEESDAFKAEVEAFNETKLKFEADSAELESQLQAVALEREQNAAFEQEYQDKVKQNETIVNEWQVYFAGIINLQQVNRSDLRR
jgi:hypothetical protein